MNKKLSLNITTDDSEYNSVSLRLETEQIFLSVKEDSVIIAGCWLSAFEAQTIASALLQMAKRLENNPYDVLEEMPQDEPIIEDMTDYQIEKMRQERQVPIGETYQAYEKTLNERIEYVHSEVIGTTIRKLLKMQSGLEVFATLDVWEKEKHLQKESDNDSPSFMNIKLDAEANWWLVDCLPF